MLMYFVYYIYNIVKNLLTFRDSLQLLNSSLSKLVDILDKDDFLLTRQFWEDRQGLDVEECIDLVTRKGLIKFLSFFFKFYKKLQILFY